MYLADEEVKGLFRRALEWLRESGVLFFRESCFRQSGDKARKYNPTHYRSPADYFRMLEEVSTEVSPGRWACYEMDFCRSVESYVKVKGNQNQLAFRMRKVFRSTPHSEEPRFALDDGPCSMEALADLQRIHGSGFTETGGADFAKHLADMLGVSRDADALIVGCGAGGAAVALAQETGAQVQGMDASVNAFMTALQHSSSAKVPVGFETCVLTSRMPLHGVFGASPLRGIFSAPASPCLPSLPHSAVRLCRTSCH